MSTMTTATPQTIFMFKISLKYNKPEVWRRVLVPGDYTFKDLHDVIIKVMGWSDFHMHKFSMKHPVTDKEIEIGGVGDLGYGDYLWLPESTKIAHYFITPKQKATYEYDFGSPWYHVILFEKTIPANIDEKYPLCVGGKRATPPEEDPGSDYSEDEVDSEFFDLDLVNSRLRKTKPVKSETTSQPPDNVSEQQSENLDNVDENLSQTLNAPPTEEDTNEVKESIDASKVLEVNSENIEQQLNLPKKRRVIHLDSSLSSAPKVQRVQNTETTPVSNANGAIEKNQPSQSHTSIMSQLESDVDEDIEDAYGKYVASQMRLITDLEAREELRIEIQKAIKKYRFKKS